MRLLNKPTSQGLTGRSTPPLVVVVAVVLFMTIFITLQTLVQWHPDWWFVRTFLAHGRVWILSVAMLWLVSRGLDALERRMKGTAEKGL